MQSEVHSSDPAPEFPEWRARAQVVADLAKIAAREEEEEEEEAQAGVDSLLCGDEAHVPGDWKDLAPRVLSWDVIASSEKLRPLWLAPGMEGLGTGPSCCRTSGVCGGRSGGELDDPQTSLQPDDRHSRSAARAELHLAGRCRPQGSPRRSPVCRVDLQQVALAWARAACVSTGKMQLAAWRNAVHTKVMRSRAKITSRRSIHSESCGSPVADRTRQERTSLLAQPVPRDALVRNRLPC